MAQLHVVGTTLSAEAKKSSGDIADAYGRSAFNRYYYAAYLAVRDLLIQFNPDWDVSHADAPSLVKITLPDLVRREAKRLQKSKALSHADEQRICSGVASAGASIAEILDVAYKVRVISDYRPEKQVSFDKATFHLDDHSEGEARSWLGTVEMHKARILRLGKELELV
jgi:hypothetical protein